MPQLLIKIETNKSLTREQLNNILQRVIPDINFTLMEREDNNYTLKSSRYGVDYKATIEIDTVSVNEELE